MSARELLVAGLAALGACSGKPDFYQTDGTQIYGCFDEGARPAIEVTFRNQGRAADVKIGSDSYQLTYQGDRFFTEIYSGGDVEMTLDPEIHITKDGERLAGPCTR